MEVVEAWLFSLPPTTIPNSEGCFFPALLVPRVKVKARPRRAPIIHVMYTAINYAYIHTPAHVSAAMYVCGHACMYVRMYQFAYVYRQATASA